jgi:hypothetical protein
MGRLRSVNTNFWLDGYISKLTPEEKLLFLYLLTCPQSNVAGVFECTLRQMVFDTGLKEQMINKTLAKFNTAGKVRRAEDYVILVNHHKNQKLNPSMEAARKAIVANLPEYAMVVYNKNGTPEPELPLDEKAGTENQHAPKTLAEREAEFKATIFTQEHAVKFGKPMLHAFYTYWAEPTRSGSKMRMELQPTWKLGGRLATWAGRDMKGKPQGGGRIYHE